MSVYPFFTNFIYRVFMLRVFKLSNTRIFHFMFSLLRYFTITQQFRILKFSINKTHLNGYRRISSVIIQTNQSTNAITNFNSSALIFIIPTVAIRKTYQSKRISLHLPGGHLIITSPCTKL